MEKRSFDHDGTTIAAQMSDLSSKIQHRSGRGQGTAISGINARFPRLEPFHDYDHSFRGMVLCGYDSARSMPNCAAAGYSQWSKASGCGLGSVDRHAAVLATDGNEATAIRPVWGGRRRRKPVLVGASTGVASEQRWARVRAVASRAVRRLHERRVARRALRELELGRAPDGSTVVLDYYGRLPARCSGRAVATVQQVVSFEYTNLTWLERVITRAAYAVSIDNDGHLAVRPPRRAGVCAAR